jgi:lipopolysaccharide export system permease protein
MLQNKIYQNYIKEILKSFFVILFSLSIIAWAVKAVNYLDLIVDNGYSVAAYLAYSILSLTGVLMKFMPLSFLVSIVFFITKHKDENEFTILWTSGIKKIHIVNLLFFSSILILVFYLIFSIFITPFSLNQSRKLLSNKNEISIIPTIKKNEFSDVFKGLTLFVNDKIDNEIKNIFIFDNSGNFKHLSNNKLKNELLSIIAQKGIVEKNEMILLNGQIVTSSKENQDSKMVKFDQMNLNLGNIDNNVIKQPKIQETSTLSLLYCFVKEKEKNFCNSSARKELIPTLNRRLIMPFYIPIITLLSCLLFLNKKNKFLLNKFTIFILAFAVLIFAELFIRYTGLNKSINYLFILFPFIFLPILYLILSKKFAYETDHK